jgi:hypothetical protein
MGGTTTLTRAAAPVTLALALAACGGEPLSARDPHGYEACSLLIRSQQSTDFATSFDAMLGASREAKQAVTPQIRDAVKEVIAGYGVPDGDKFIEACEAQGVPVPAKTSVDPNS